MKSSNYNTFIEYEKEWIAHNGLTNSLVILTDNEMKGFNDYLETGNGLDVEQILDFKTNGFLIEDDCDELDIIRYRMYSDRYNEENLSLVIAPTSNCNFRCPYCFESSVLRNCRMNESIKKGILQFVNSKIDSIKHLDVCWYGGEPLLELNTIIEMSNEFISICIMLNIMQVLLPMDFY